MKPHAKIQPEESRKSNILQTTARQRCVSYQQAAWSQPCPAAAPSLLQSRGSKLHSIYTAQAGAMPAPHTNSTVCPYNGYKTLLLCSGPACLRQLWFLLLLLGLS